MTIRLVWDNPEQTILRWDFLGTWTWTHVHEQLVEAAMMMRPCSHIVHFMVDVYQGPNCPAEAVENLRILFNTTPSNTGVLVLVGTDSRGRDILRLFQRAFPADGYRFAFVDTVEDARRVLAGTV